jgi:hypothetical protein
MVLGGMQEHTELEDGSKKEINFAKQIFAISSN